MDPDDLGARRSRNGLYILRYTGPKAREIAGVRFLEGNSNLGDAVRLAKSDGP